MRLMPYRLQVTLELHAVCSCCGAKKVWGDHYFFKPLKLEKSWHHQSLVRALVSYKSAETTVKASRLRMTMYWTTAKG
jgi:hypothetical protein